MLRDRLTDRVVAHVQSHGGGLEKQAFMGSFAAAGASLANAVTNAGIWGAVLALTTAGAGGWLLGAGAAAASSPSRRDFEAVRSSMRNVQEKRLLNMLKGRSMRKDFRRAERAAMETDAPQGGDREIRL